MMKRKRKGKKICRQQSDINETKLQPIYKLNFKIDNFSLSFDKRLIIYDVIFHNFNPIAYC